MAPEDPETAIAPITPRGLDVQRIDTGDAPAVRIKQRWPWLKIAGAILPFGALTIMPVPATLVMIVAWLAVWSAGWLDVSSVTLDDRGVTGGGVTIPFDQIAGCELRGRLRVKLAVVLHDGRRVRVFFGSHRQAAWVARAIEQRARGGAVPLSLPPARLLPARR